MITQIQQGSTDSAAKGRQVVNSWNEWDPLEEIIVGSATGACYEPVEPGNKPIVRNVEEAKKFRFPKGEKPRDVIDAANEELQGLVTFLQSRGVSVKRPTPVDFSKELRTPIFEVPNQYCSTCPRDVLLTVGNEIVEATMSRRARFFEYLNYRNIIYQYWDADPAFRWTCAPKPTMHDNMYRSEFWDWPLEKRFEKMHAFEFCVTQSEVLFDAADVCRFGKDLFVQESMTTNRPGIKWLARHFEPQGLRVNPVHFPLDFFPSHIDCTFVPLRPGFVLTNPDRPLNEDEAVLFEKNGWEFIDAPAPVSNEMPAHCQSSKWLAMNVLSLSPKTVICEARELPLQELLDRHGFEVIPLPFRSVYEFGGSFHCATLDVRRSGSAVDYFPLRQ